MKIVSVDAGALSSPQAKQFGNYTFSFELISALLKYDKKNNYRFYLQSPFPKLPRQNSVILKPKLGWLKLRVSLREFVKPSNVFLGLNQALPLYCGGKKIVFCHGLAPLKYPQLYPDSRRRIAQQIRQMLKEADLIIVGSKRLKNSLNDISGVGERNAKNKIKVINYGIPTFLADYKKAGKKRALLYVGSPHPIKNLSFLLKAFSEFIKLRDFRDYRLYLAGVGSDFDIHGMKQVVVIPHAKGEQLSTLYRQASCLVTASLEESFNLPVLEALSQNTPVVGTRLAIIPELAPYVNLAPGSPAAFAKVIAKTITSPKPINLNALRKQFSWQKYVQKLTAFYERN